MAEAGYPKVRGVVRNPRSILRFRPQCKSMAELRMMHKAHQIGRTEIAHLTEGEYFDRFLMLNGPRSWLTPPTYGNSGTDEGRA